MQCAGGDIQAVAEPCRNSSRAIDAASWRVQDCGGQVDAVLFHLSLALKSFDSVLAPASVVSLFPREYALMMQAIQSFGALLDEVSREALWG